LAFRVARFEDRRFGNPMRLKLSAGTMKCNAAKVGNGAQTAASLDTSNSRGLVTAANYLGVPSLGRTQDWRSSRFRVAVRDMDFVAWLFLQEKATLDTVCYRTRALNLH